MNNIPAEMGERAAEKRNRVRRQRGCALLQPELSCSQSRDYL